LKTVWCLLHKQLIGRQQMRSNCVTPLTCRGDRSPVLPTDKGNWNFPTTLTKYLPLNFGLPNCWDVLYLENYQNCNKQAHINTSTLSLSRTRNLNIIRFQVQTALSMKATILKCFTVQSGRSLPKFQRCVTPRSSRW
jgi:hypothetical protein